MRKARIALVGLPGVGKTTIGRLLAERLGWELFDCDAVFEREFAASIADWVAVNGWPAFRDHESRILATALARENLVIATGGGVVEDAANNDALASSATVVWLDAPTDVLAARLGVAADRPLLADAPLQRLKELSERRHALYAALADLRIDVADSSPARIVEHIVHALVPSPFGTACRPG